MEKTNTQQLSKHVTLISLTNKSNYRRVALVFFFENDKEGQHILLISVGTDIIKDFKRRRLLQPSSNR